MTDKELQQLNWKEFNERFIVRIEKCCANVWVVPKTDSNEIELRVEAASGRTFAFCLLTREDAQKVVEKLQEAMQELR